MYWYIFYILAISGAMVSYPDLASLLSAKLRYVGIVRAVAGLFRWILYLFRYD